MRPEFVPPSTTGGAGDKLHPNRAGYLAMGNAVELRLLSPATAAAAAPAAAGAPRRPTPREAPPE